MFDFTMKYLGFLRHIPLLPRIFDALLNIQVLFASKEVLCLIDEIEQEVLRWEHTRVRVHRFGGTQFDVKAREIGHIHGNGLLDILFPRGLRDTLVLEGRVRPHHVFKNSGWISFYIREKEDKKFALRLLREAYLLKLHL